MFHKPNEELKKLEEQLLAVEEPQVEEEDFDVFYEDILKEFGPGQATPAPQKKVHRTVSQATDYTDNAKKHKKSKKRRQMKGLIVTLCLECVGIFLVLVWWMLRIL